ncbi:uncharacterized protein BJ171DRAFT_600426 [Polychytrium aggregatum]|uniref:uncharacterized protein n=1 Tax=Polychytrium aggregatum TaxID=110093 RepID=UPI0022FEC2AA|nr:uncharacterized protein BJ171DRAFT_600426 [Polychytrium aggregatum]KAI9202982.1 hypothetical protein BJ171DRAFT_600426 [Polychytrium aggregatum]
MSTPSSISYVLQKDFGVGPAFYDQFAFQNSGVPGGFAYYVDRPTALQSGLINGAVSPVGSAALAGGATYLFTDNQTVVPATSTGRSAIRLESVDRFAQGLYIFDVQHVPTGCGVWPALWFKKSTNATLIAEIDIMETINQRDQNHYNIYTGPGCYSSPADRRNQTSTITGVICDGNIPKQPDVPLGCANNDEASGGIGALFNQNGGGVYALNLDLNQLAIYFFPRSNIPTDIAQSKPNPSTWGEPEVYFPFDCCSPDYFQDMTFIIDTNLCGSWLSNAADAACPMTTGGEPVCDAYVANTPSAFGEAYWAINSIKLYQPTALTSFNPDTAVTCPTGAIVTAAPRTGVAMATASPIAVSSAASSSSPTTSPGSAPAPIAVKTSGARSAHHVGLASVLVLSSLVLSLLTTLI